MGCNSPMVDNPLPPLPCPSNYKRAGLEKRRRVSYFLQMNKTSCVMRRELALTAIKLLGSNARAYEESHLKLSFI